MYSPSTGDTGSFSRQMSGGRYAVPLPPPLAIEEARKSVIGELAILMRIERAVKGSSGGLQDHGRNPLGDRTRNTGGGASSRRLRGHRRRSEFSGDPVRGGPALARAGLEPQQHFRPWRALPVSRHPRSRRRPDAGRRKARSRLQRDENSRRSLPHHRKGLLGCRPPVEGAAGRDPFQCACPVPVAQKSHRPAIRRDPGYAAEWSASTSPPVFFVPTAA